MGEIVRRHESLRTTFREVDGVPVQVVSPFAGFALPVDDLSALVQSAGEKREAAVAQAEAIVEQGVQGFVQWLERRETIPLIQALHAQADDWRSVEIARARKAIAGGESVDTVLEMLSRGLTQKMLHGTLAELGTADGDERARLTQTVSRLFLRRPPRAPGER